MPARISTRNSFSWSPYKSEEHAGHRGRRFWPDLHTAAAGYSAPARSFRPLSSGFAVFGAADPIAAIERISAGRPALGAFLAARDWRSDVERLMLPAHRRLARCLDGLEPLWTHNDWHGANLLWARGTREPDQCWTSASPTAPPRSTTSRSP